MASLFMMHQLSDACKDCKSMRSLHDVEAPDLESSLPATMKVSFLALVLVLSPVTGVLADSLSASMLEDEQTDPSGPPSIAASNPGSGSPMTSPTNSPATALDASAPVDCNRPSVDDKCEDWTAPANSHYGRVVVSSDSQTVYTDEPEAYDAEAGEQLWSASAGLYVWELAIGPNDEVLVTGGTDSGHYHITAWDANTGERMWTADDMEGSLGDFAFAPDGHILYATGTSGTAAYDPATGNQLWVSQAGSGGISIFGGGFGVEAGPDGEKVYIAIEGAWSPHQAAAVDASTGDVLWNAEVSDPEPGHLYGMDLSPDGRMLVVSGEASEPFVAAFDTSEGALAWSDTFETAQLTSMPSSVEATAVAVGPESQTVYAQAGAAPTAAGYAYVIAYELATGEEEWTHLEKGAYATPTLDTLAVHPDGSRVYAGLAPPHTVAMDAESGETAWIAEIDSGSTTGGIAVAPDGSRVFSSYGSLAGYETGGPDAKGEVGVPADLSSSSPASPVTTPNNQEASPEGRQANVELTRQLANSFNDAGQPPHERAMDAARQVLDQRIQLARQAGGEAVPDGSFARIQQNLDVSERILHIEADASLDAIEKTLQIAELGVQDRQMLTAGLDRRPGEVSLAPVDPGQRDIDATRQLLEEMDHERESELADSIELAKQASRHQAEQAGLGWQQAPSAPTHESPSRAARELVDRYAITPTAEQQDEIGRLDELPEPVRGELTDLIDAFLAFDQALADAYEDADIDALQAMDEGPTIPPWELVDGEDVYGLEEQADPQAQGLPDRSSALTDALAASEATEGLVERFAEAGVDLGEVLPARTALLDAAVDLERALKETGPTTPTSVAGQPLVSLPPALAVDVMGEDHVYTEDYALVVDTGGQDRYENNAGGNGLLGEATGDCRLDALGSPSHGPLAPAAAVFDYGQSSDVYASGDRSCGVRGGGYLGAGMLVDAGGHDTFAPSDIGPQTGTGDSAEVSSKDTMEPTAPTFGLDDAAAKANQRGAPQTDRQESSGDEGDQQERYVVGLHQMSDDDVGDAFHGAEILEVSQPLGFLVAEPEASQAFLAEVSEDPSVRYVEAEIEVELDDAPNDPRFDDQHGIADIGAPEAWQAGFGDVSRSVCIVDTGVDAGHPDLDAARYVGGYDFANNDANPADGNGHGTHVTGIAAATVDNAEGIAGVGNVGFQAVKVFPDAGSASGSDIAQGIQWCTDNGADVISMSFSYEAPAPVTPGPLYYGFTAIEDAIENADEEGVLLVTSAGNDGCFDCITYPGVYEEVITVTCTDRNRSMCSFSSYGPQAELAAPGDEILSTIPQGSAEADYWRLSGTSMSTPFVAGTAALAWSHAEDLGHEELRQLLQDNAEDLGPTGCDERFGQGLVDAAATVQAVVDDERPAFQGTTECLHGGWFGTNGGGHLGVGLLVNAGQGEDVLAAGGVGTNGGASNGLGGLVSGQGPTGYASTERGTNGGAEQGLGFLVDAGGNDTYEAASWGTNGGSTEGTGFLLDAAGNDVYRSGNGGTNGGSYIDLIQRVASGFLFDAGGHDTYQAEAGGTNGGGNIQASGTLLDAGGDDHYTATFAGTNGGAHLDGTGTLVDVGGEDSYLAGNHGTNGGAYASSGQLAGGTSENVAKGMLVDVGGNETYTATHAATNGGAVGDESYGFLLDTEGTNRYEATLGGTNGGGSFGGYTHIDRTENGFEEAGFLFDASERDTTYTATRAGANGGALNRHTGFLMDAGGNDSYDATRAGTNGGSLWNSAAFLVDGSGDDVYQATAMGTNGGAGSIDHASALLLDLAGHDGYHATNLATNGGGFKSGALASLIDLEGDDVYDARGLGANGGGFHGTGFLADRSGNDTYMAASSGTNGGGLFTTWPEHPDDVGESGERSVGDGFLIDREGDDVYEAGGCGANGAGAECSTFTIGGTASQNALGRLVDAAGTDTYEDDGVSCTDCTQTPKGTLGAQIDTEANGEAAFELVPRLDQSSSRAPVLGPPAAAWGVDGVDVTGQQHRNLALVDELLDEGDTQADGLQPTVDKFAKLARWQARTLGIEDPLSTEESPVEHDQPSQAAFTLLERHGVQISGEDRAEVEALDTLPADVPSALGDVLDAFIVLEITSERAYGGGAIEASHPSAPNSPLLAPASAQARTSTIPHASTIPEGPEVGPILSARNGLLQAFADLSEALADTRQAGAHEQAPSVHQPPALILNLDENSDDTYTNDTALMIDGGGSDTYNNNAGGARFFDMPCCPAAALVDLGEANDTYGDPLDPRSGGANGGARTATGLLLDEGGNDTYTAGEDGTNGGGTSRGLGLLADLGSGNDTYNTVQAGVNGGGLNGGLGALLDRGGNDTYNVTPTRILQYASPSGANGGSDGGIGFLFDDGAGADLYNVTCPSHTCGGANGGSAGGIPAGVGFLLDAAGNSTYNATSSRANGYAGNRASGFLYDDGGTDGYADVGCTDCTIAPKGTTVNGVRMPGVQYDSDDGPADWVS